MLKEIKTKDQNLFSLMWLSFIFLIKNYSDYFLLLIFVVFIKQANIPIPYIGYLISVFTVALCASHTIRLAIYDKTSIKHTLYFIRENLPNIFQILLIAYTLKYLINDFLLTEIFNSLSIPWLKSLLHNPVPFLTATSIHILLIDFFDIFFTYYPIYSYLHLNMIKLNAIDCSFNLIKHKPLKSIGYILGSSILISLTMTLISMLLLQFLSISYLQEKLTINITSSIKMICLTIFQAAIFINLVDKGLQTRKYYSKDEMKSIFR